MIEKTGKSGQSNSGKGIDFNAVFLAPRCGRSVHAASRHDAGAFLITQPDLDRMRTGLRVHRLKAEQISVASRRH